MSTARSRLDATLQALSEIPAPPPSAALEALVREFPPVSPRRPLRALGLVLLASLAMVGIDVYTYDLRHDFTAIPKWWFWTMAAAWLTAFVIALAVALVPQPGSMFVNVRVARFVAIAVPALAVIMAVFLRIDAPPATFMPTTAAEIWGRTEWCLVTGLEMSAVPFALGILVLRRAPQPIRTCWIGAALGAANGTLAGLMLHFHCWIGGGLHTGVAHGGGAVVGAIIGALLLPALEPRSQD